MHSLAKTKAAEDEVNVKSTEILQTEKSLDNDKSHQKLLDCPLSFCSNVSACLLFVSMFGCWLPSTAPFCFIEF